MSDSEEDGSPQDWRLVKQRGNKSVGRGIKLTVSSGVVSIVSFAFGQTNVAYASLTTMAGGLGDAAHGYYSLYVAKGLKAEEEAAERVKEQLNAPVADADESTRKALENAGIDLERAEKEGKTTLQVLDEEEEKLLENE